MLDAVGVVADARRQPMVVEFNSRDHAVGSDLGAVGEGVGNMGDQRGGFCIDLAPLQAESSVDAVGTVAEPAVGDRHRSDPSLESDCRRAPEKDLTVPAHRLRRVPVGVGIAPGPILARHRQFVLDVLVVGLQILIGDRPVCADAVDRRSAKVRRMESGGIAGVVDHRSAHPAAGIVRTQGTGSCPVITRGSVQYSR